MGGTLPDHLKVVTVLLVLEKANEWHLCDAIVLLPCPNYYAV